MHCKLHYISKAFGPKIWPDLETKWQSVISRWGLVRPHEPYHGLERGLLLFDLLIEHFLVALSSVLLIELSHADKKFFIKPELNHWNINNHRKTYPWRSNFSESGWQYHRWFYCCVRITLHFSSDYQASHWDFCFRSSPKSQWHVDYWFSMPVSETTRSNQYKLRQ